MARPFYLIDGYNLMHAAGMARNKYGPGDLERCRTRFLNYLAVQLNSTERERTTVVFDAIDAPRDVARHFELDAIQIVFADPEGDADTLIEEFIASHSAPRQLVVVSSDHRLQRAAKRRRASSVDSERFFDRLERRTEQSEARPAASPEAIAKRTGQISEAEAREWYEIFRDAVDELSPGEDENRSKLQAEIDDILDEFNKSED